LGAEGAVVDRFRLRDLTVAPFTNALRRCQRDANRVKILNFHALYTLYSLVVFVMAPGRFRLKPNRGMLSVVSSLPKWMTSFFSLITSTSRPRLCNSLTSTRKLSGTPGLWICSPLTIASYVLTRP